MNRSGRTLVVLLSMHRSGSSFTTSALHEMGMSLGPFELLGAEPHNVHGHFEAMPILQLSREVQVKVYGFPDEFPETPETMSRFIESRGEWDETIEVPEELIDRGRSLLGTLVDSGEVSGFKDPRTVLLWPFWRRVLIAFPEIRVAPIILLRSPHEIAMSLFTRREGVAGYRTSLDLVAVHFLRLRAILEAWPVEIPRLCFGGDQYLADLAGAVSSCGLAWDPSRVERIFDGSSVHHVPAVVVHEAQDVFDSLRGAEARPVEEAANQVRLQADAMAREDLLERQLDRSRDQTSYLNGQLNLLSSQKLEVERLLRESQEESGRKEETLQATRFDLGRTEATLQTTRFNLGQTEAALQTTRLDLGRTEELLHRSQRDASESHDELVQALARCAHLQARIDRLEGHPVIGLALRARRVLRKAVQSLHKPHFRNGAHTNKAPLD